MHCATCGARHDTSQRLPLSDVLHELWELSVELVIVVLPVLFESVEIDELFVIVELLVIVELFVTVAELFESIEFVMLVELPACTEFPRPSVTNAPAACAPEAQSARASAKTWDFIKTPISVVKKPAAVQPACTT